MTSIKGTKNEAPFKDLKPVFLQSIEAIAMSLSLNGQATNSNFFACNAKI